MNGDIRVPPDNRSRRDLSLLLMTHTVGNLGDILYIALMVNYLLKASGSAFVAALFPFVRVLAMFGSSFVSPLLLERLPLVRLLSITRAGETMLLLVLAGSIAAGTDPVWWLLALVTAVSFLQGWSDPVVYSLIPRLADAGRLARVNAQFGTAREIGSIAAWGIGGALAVWMDPAVVLAGCALLFAAGLLATLGLNAVPPEPREDGSSKWDAVRAGWRELLRNPVARSVTAMDVLEGLAWSIWAGAFTLVFVQDRLGQTESFWGFLNAAYFAGMIAGGFLVARLSAKLHRRLPAALLLGSLGYGVMTLVYAYTASPVAALVLVALMGLPMMARDTAQRTLLQLNVEGAKLPNVLVAHGALGALVFAVSLLLMGAAAEVFGIRSIYVIGGMISIGSAAVGGLMFARYRGRVNLSKVTEQRTEEV